MEPEFSAQFGEDRILAKRFAGRQGYYVEVGALDGRKLSNTWYFEQIGWTGLLVEADPDIANICRANRPGSRVEACAVVAPGTSDTVSFEVCTDDGGLSTLEVGGENRRLMNLYTGGTNTRTISVPARTLDVLLEGAGCASIDFVTIDVEGQEWAVLQGFSLQRWQPEVVILERNGWGFDDRIIQQLHAAGYHYSRSTNVNDWFELRPRPFGYVLQLFWAGWGPRVLRSLRYRLFRR